MNELEKVIKGLEETADDLRAWQTMADKADRGQLIAMENRVNDAIELLKAQEPRMMTLEEIKDYNGECLCWLEWIFAKDDPTMFYAAVVRHRPNTDVIDYIGFNHSLGFRENEYNKTVRCWTSRPTEEQRKAVKWDG